MLVFVSRAARCQASVRFVARNPSKVFAANISIPPTPERKENEDVNSKKSSTVDESKPIFGANYFRELFHTNKNGIIAAGSIVTVVGVSSLLYGVGTNFMSLFSMSALYYGVTVGATATAMNVAEKSFRVDPEAVVSLAMTELRKNKDLLNILGHKIAPGDVKSYTASNSGFGIIGAVPRLIHPKIQVVFPLTGSTSPAVVSAVYTKKGLFTKQCEYVGVDWTNPAGVSLTLTLIGEEGKFTMKGAIKEHAKVLAASKPAKF